MFVFYVNLSGSEFTMSFFCGGFMNAWPVFPLWSECVGVDMVHIKHCIYCWLRKFALIIWSNHTHLFLKGLNSFWLWMSLWFCTWYMQQQKKAFGMYAVTCFWLATLKWPTDFERKCCCAVMLLRKACSLLWSLNHIMYQQFLDWLHKLWSVRRFFFWKKKKI